MVQKEILFKDILSRVMTALLISGVEPFMQFVEVMRYISAKLF